VHYLIKDTKVHFERITFMENSKIYAGSEHFRLSFFSIGNAIGFKASGDRIF